MQSRSLFLAKFPRISLKRKRTQVSENVREKQFTVFTDKVFFASSLGQSSLVEVLKDDGSERIWSRSMIECIEGGKALLLFPETTRDGEHGEWLDLNIELGEMSDASSLNGAMVCGGPFPPNIRPLMKLGNLPKQILRSDCCGAQKIFTTGRAVEAWLNNSWKEGVLMGFNRHSLLVKLVGHPRSLRLDPSIVRLAPVWKGDLRSWQLTVVKVKAENLNTSDDVDGSPEMFSETNSRAKQFEGDRRNHDFLPITARQFSSRAAMLHSDIVSWSPPLGPLAESDSLHRKDFSNYCSVLAVGGRSGIISFWRICGPKCYTIKSGVASLDGILIGILQAHNSWITAISWGLYDQEASIPKFVLVVGSSNGSVKIWHGSVEELLKSSEPNSASFSLLKEVTTFDHAPVSILSIVVLKLEGKILFAIGKGSGSLEVWTYHKYDCKFQNVGYGTHDQAVTGLAWTSDGCCFFSSSQDNCIRSWMLKGDVLLEACSPSICHTSKGPFLPLVFDSCFGVALSPGNLMLAVVRSCDIELLNPMYQGRTQKAAVEFLWVGGQYLEVSSQRDCDYHGKAFPVPSKRDLSCWECNILWSLKQFEDISKPLVLWDIVSALTAFNRFATDFVEYVLLKWISNMFLGENTNISTEQLLVEAPIVFQKNKSRHLHMLNIIIRRLMIRKGDSDRPELWTKLLKSSEKELRERLVALTFLTILSLVSCPRSVPSGVQLLLGVSQMERWAATTQEFVPDRLKEISSEVRQRERRIQALGAYVREEKCSFCSAEVPFESPDFAFCKGKECNGTSDTRHKLQRCAVSMVLCPLTPLWFCMCCERWVYNLPLQALFALAASPLHDANFSVESHSLVRTKPFCPFCGILLQRYMPEFLLSPHPV